MCFIKKPHKFRISYEKSYPLLIIGNKNYMTIYDYDNNTITRLNKDKNPLSLFTNVSSDINKHFKYIGYREARWHDLNNKDKYTDKEKYTEIFLEHIASDKLISLILNNNSLESLINSKKKILTNKSNIISFSKPSIILKIYNNTDISDSDNISFPEVITYFNNIEYVKSINDKIFTIKDPDIFGPIKKIPIKNMLKYYQPY
ncbi:MAG TPA: outer-membrane lipoprotein carrier protein LolA [Candidatus Megaira endosymbiont of Hartmannula sinica]|nr:outer-membrane lipoprotein carrier protein LolA [Candidatus Megaera endosymbiont of Hartmannula sinica]